MESYYWQADCCCDPLDRSFMTREEKIDILEEYKEALDKESQGVAEKITELKSKN